MPCVCVKCSEAKFNIIYIKRVRIRAFDSQSNKNQSALGHILFLFHELVGQFTKYGLVRIGPLFENGAPQRQAIGTFDVCLVRPHAAQLVIDTSVNQFLQNMV